MTAVQVADGVWRIPTAPADVINSYLVAGSDGSLVLVDAGTKRAPKALLAALASLGKAPGDVTHLLLSHAHGDHWGNTMDFARAGAEVIGPAEIAGYASRQGAHRTVGMSIGGTLRRAWGSVRLTPAWHSSSFPDGTYGGMPTGLVVEFGRKRFYHAGDTCLFSDMRLIGDLGLDLAGANAPLLAPGYGAQGGGPDDIARVFGAAVGNVLPSASRSVLAAGPTVDGLRAAAAAEARALADQPTAPATAQ